MAFGGPQGPADVRPFLENVLRGRRVAPGRVDEVAHHYELFGGVSPLTALTLQQAEGLRARLAAAGLALPVYVGMRNWHPYLKDTLAAMSRRRDPARGRADRRGASQLLELHPIQGERRCRAAALRQAGLADVEITYVSDWHTAPGFVEANASRVHDVLTALPSAPHSSAELVFTAHSIPVSMAERYPYRQQFEETARLVAARVNEQRDPARHCPTPPFIRAEAAAREDPWLGAGRRRLAAWHAGSRGVRRGDEPAGFLVDHIEVLYDLDRRGGGGRPRARTDARARRHRSASTRPFLDMLSGVVTATARRYERGTPLQVVASPEGGTGATPSRPPGRD